MSAYTITHPHATAAVWLAYRLRGASPDLITHTINASGIPRGLYVLAAVLLAASTRGI
jgi:hypothetical protein